MHPLVNDLDHLKESELENKINDLTRKYFQTINTEVKQQIAMILDEYKTALQRKRDIEYQKMIETRNKDLDKLIKVD
jgi:hypothetical protein